MTSRSINPAVQCYCYVYAGHLSTTYKVTRMHTHDLSHWTHEHVFNEETHSAERGTRAVMWITAAMMMVEIVAGWWFNSMALLADGWHMSSHAVAIGLSAF